MHILFLSHYFPPEVNAPATRTLEHCRRWVAAGHRVTVVTCAPNCPHGKVYPGYRNAWRSEEEIEGIRVLRVWTYLAANKGVYGRLANFASYLLTATLRAASVHDVDLILATSPQFFCGWAGVLCKWICRRPLVLEVRDIWPESITVVGAMKRSLVIRFLEILERRMYAAANHIVTLGEGYKEKLLERHVADEKIAIIPNGVDVQQFSPRDADDGLRRQWKGEGKFVCSYVGTIGMAHGLEVVVHAATRLQQANRHQFQFWIVGDGAQRQRLQDAVTERRLDNVRFTGLLPKKDIARVIASSDACLVHLRAAELFESVLPSKIFEIMAMNTPIIMAVKGPARRVVLEAHGGIAMEPEDPASLIDCLEILRAAPAGKYRQGRRYVVDQFNRDRLAQDMLEVLKAQVAGKPLARPGPIPLPTGARAPGEKVKQAA